MDQVLNDAIVPKLGEDFKLCLPQTQNWSARLVILDVWLSGKDLDCVYLRLQVHKLLSSKKRFVSS